MEYNSKRFVAAIRAKRVVDKKNNISISISKAAQIIGISKVTLSRIELGSYPDLTTYAMICQWLDKPMETFFCKK